MIDKSGGTKPWGEARAVALGRGAARKKAGGGP